MPGIDEKDIDVRIENTTLTVHGERKIEKEEKEENFRRVERHYGEFTRLEFTLPSSVDPAQVRKRPLRQGRAKDKPWRKKRRSQASKHDQGDC